MCCWRSGKWSHPRVIFRSSISARTSSWDISSVWTINRYSDMSPFPLKSTIYCIHQRNAGIVEKIWLIFSRWTKNYKLKCSLLTPEKWCPTRSAIRRDLDSPTQPEVQGIHQLFLPSGHLQKKLFNAQQQAGKLQIPIYNVWFNLTENQTRTCYFSSRHVIH